MKNESKNALQQVFRRSRVFLPVIHPGTKKSALQSIDTAVRSGADGIFLINQGMSSAQVLDFIPQVYQRHPNLWIGVNLLGTEPEEVIGLVAGLPVGGDWSCYHGSSLRLHQRLHRALIQKADRHRHRRHCPSLLRGIPVGCHHDSELLGHIRGCLHECGVDRGRTRCVQT